jgi:hypothetical protein
MVSATMLILLLALSQKVTVESRISRENMYSQQALQAANTGLDAWQYQWVQKGDVDIAIPLNSTWPNSSTIGETIETDSSGKEWIELSSVGVSSIQYRVEFQAGNILVTPPILPLIIAKGRVVRGNTIIERTLEQAFQVSSVQVKDGSSVAKAAPSAKYLVEKGFTSNGAYWIDLPVVGPTKVYCILDPIYAGGGWMMMMKATQGTTFGYDSNHWTTATVLNPNDTTRNDSDAKFNTMNYFEAQDIMAIWPDIQNGGSINASQLGWTWLAENFNGAGNANKIAPINFFSKTYPMTSFGGGKFIMDAKTFSGWKNGIFSSQPDIQFYGFNYVSYPYGGVSHGKVRWGFGWNENGEGLYSLQPSTSTPYIGSNDVSGGIGMGGVWGVNGTNYSAGDVVHCCNDSTGINRKARVEVYIR